ncbi:MAG: SLC13 family permease [Nocardioidaceae bacterium]
MPAALVDAVAVLALVALLVVAFAHPRGRVEAAAGLLAAAAVLGTGGVGWADAGAQVARLLPVVGFLAAILVVAEVCAAEGLFVALGALVARAAGGRPRTMLVLTFAVAAAVTVTLSLDATVVLLTPVVVAAATASATSPRPAAFACVRLANSASLLLPVSNLTNLLAMPYLHLTFLGFAARMAPAWLVVLAVEYVAQRLFFRRDLAEVGVRGAPEPVALPVVPLAVVAAMLGGFAVGSRFDVAPAWVAAAAAVVLAGYSLHRGRVTPARVLGAAHLPFALFVLALGVVVAALDDSFLGALVAHLVPSGTSLPGLLGVAVLAMVLANLVNNLPATLLLVPLAAPLGTAAVLAALVGLNVGSGLAYPGSLANLLWRRTLTRAGRTPSARTFHALSALATAPALVAAVAVLWGWTGVLGG